MELHERGLATAIPLEHNEGRNRQGQVSVEDKRRTDRVVIAIPIEVSGRDITGGEFSERAQTLVVSGQGANIVLSRVLDPGQRVTIRREARKKQADARIVGQIGGRPGGFVYGVCLLDPGVNLWGIGFPPLRESEKAVLRLLLECGVCRAREVVYLDELQTEVYEANRNVSRACKLCADWTLWKQAPREVVDLETPSLIAPDALPAPGDRARDKRKDIRVAVKTPACIRQPGFGEEVVTVENVSRGGFSFLSAKRYLEGSTIEVAISYSPGAANIFVPARIVRSQELSGEGFSRYGVRYGVSRMASHARG